jgi:hypothetical protein
MQLLELEIKKERWGVNEGKYVGHALFGNENGKVDIKLSPDNIEQIFKVCADGIVDVARSAAEELTVSVIEHQHKIESS